MGIKWTNEREVDQDFRKMESQIDSKAVTFLSRVGEMAVKYAKQNGTYTDRTGNLRNSLGYIVIQNGRVKVDSAPEPTRAYLLSLVPQYSHGTVMIWGSGMKYAKFVEFGHYAVNGRYIEPRDVIEGSGDYIESMAAQLSKEFGEYILS